MSKKTKAPTIDGVPRPGLAVTNRSTHPDFDGKWSILVSATHFLTGPDGFTAFFKTKAAAQAAYFLARRAARQIQ